jgi:hypothetical protein
MRRLIELLKGLPGHPTHPPLTDASIGAYTVGTGLLLLGWAGVEEPQMAVGGFLAVAGGLAFAVPTALTGLLEYFSITAGTPMRRTALVHMLTMILATGTFFVAELLLWDAYKTGVVPTDGAVVLIVAWLFLLFGGWAGGTIVFVHGMRVLGQPNARTADALKPKLHRRQTP